MVRAPAAQFKLVLTSVHFPTIIKSQHVRSTTALQYFRLQHPPRSFPNAIQSVKKWLSKILPPAFAFMLLYPIICCLALSFYRPNKRSINASLLKLGLSYCCRTSALTDWSGRTRTFHADAKARFSLGNLFYWLQARPIRSQLFLPFKNHGKHVHTWGEC